MSNVRGDKNGKTTRHWAVCKEAVYKKPSRHNEHFPSRYIHFTVHLPFHGLAKAMAREDNKMEEKTKTVMQIAWSLLLSF